MRKMAKYRPFVPRFRRRVAPATVGPAAEALYNEKDDVNDIGDCV